MKIMETNRCLISENELTIDRLTVEDAHSMTNWANHENELFIDYNLGGYSKNFLTLWYYSKGIGFRNKYYGVKIHGELIGYIGIKDISYFKKASVLGIVFNPAYTSQGYGYRALNLFLKYYFDVLKMKEMTLDVNLFNERAIKLYKKLGFKYKFEYLSLFENQQIDFENPLYEQYREYFVISSGKIYSKIHCMALTKIDYELGAVKNDF